MSDPENRPQSNGESGSYPERWNQPQPAKLAEPTYWPLVLAAGVTFLAWGVVTAYPLSLLGLGLTVVAMINWIGDIRRGQQQESEDS